MTQRLLSRFPAAAWLLALALLTLGVAQDSLAQAGLPQIQLRGSSLAAPGAVVTTERVRAELVAHAPEGVTSGQPLWLGLSITHQPEWHTYWKNPGDSGLPTQLDWQLPAGLAAGAIEWPLPKIIRVGPLANYGYEDRLLLPVPIQVAPDFKAPEGDTLTIRLHASWLVCRVECIPEDGDFTLHLPVRSATALHAQAFAAAQARQPAALTGQSTAKVAGERLQLRIEGLPAALQGKNLALFPETPDVLEHAALPGSGWTQAWDGAAWTADWPLSAMRGETPGELPLVVAPIPAAGSGPVGWRTVAKVEGRWPSVPVAEVSPALTAALAANAQQAAAPAVSAPGSASLWLALLGGLVGGLILNLMPCVFPVLAIKIVGFARHGQDRRALRIGGLAYGAGVLLSFLALGGLLLALRAAGQQLGWGFQLQSPGLVAAMAALFTLLGLNLAGMFEFGRMLPQRWAGAQLRHPVAESFLSGVLAVAIASPCTAPFMGASLGLAIDMPAVQALTVFAALGIGMALPYVLASWVPALVRWLPRPGDWMETFRHAMAFPMFATVAWLVWVLGQQSGIDGAGALLVLLVALGALVWALSLSGKTRWLLGGLVLLGTLWLLSAVGPHVTRAVAAQSAPTAGAGEWQPWSAERVSSLTAAGTPVFVDFTAAWCVTCQVNKHTTLNREDVRADFAARSVTLLRADWTRRDPAITAALAALGRSGVPVYVLYAPGKPPQVMTELLSPAEVHAALASI